MGKKFGPRTLELTADGETGGINDWYSLPNIIGMTK
jgi:hypothetical protein